MRRSSTLAGGEKVRPPTATRRTFAWAKARSEDEGLSVYTPTPTNALGLEAAQRVAMEDIDISMRRSKSTMSSGKGHRRMASEGSVDTVTS